MTYGQQVAPDFQPMVLVLPTVLVKGGSSLSINAAFV